MTLTTVHNVLNVRVSVDIRYDGTSRLVISGDDADDRTRRFELDAPTGLTTFRLIVEAVRDRNPDMREDQAYDFAARRWFVDLLYGQRGVDGSDHITPLAHSTEP